MIRVVLIDDHEVVRAGLRFLLPKQGDIEIIGEYDRGDGAADFVRTKRPDVTLLDVRLPGKNGTEVLQEICARDPSAKVIMLSTSSGDNDIYQSLKAGAKSYLLKDRNASEIAQAVRIVAGGALYLTDEVRKLNAERQMTPDLSAREQEVLELIVDGLTNEEIAKQMGTSVDTTKSHAKHILQKLNLVGRSRLVMEALRRGFVKR